MAVWPHACAAACLHGEPAEPLWHARPQKDGRPGWAARTHPSPPRGGPAAQAKLEERWGGVPSLSVRAQGATGAPAPSIVLEPRPLVSQPTFPPPVLDPR